MPCLLSGQFRTFLSLSSGWERKEVQMKRPLSHCGIIDHVVENLVQLQGGETGWKWMPGLGDRIPPRLRVSDGRHGAGADPSVRCILELQEYFCLKANPRTSETGWALFREVCLHFGPFWKATVSSRSSGREKERWTAGWETWTLMPSSSPLLLRPHLACSWDPGGCQTGGQTTSGGCTPGIQSLCPEPARQPLGDMFYLWEAPCQSSLEERVLPF